MTVLDTICQQAMKRTSWWDLLVFYSCISSTAPHRHASAQFYQRHHHSWHFQKWNPLKHGKI